MHQGMTDYAHSVGRPLPAIDFTMVVACPDRGRQIAEAYEAAPVFEPSAIPVYKAFIRETVRQFQLLTRPTWRGGLGVAVVLSWRDPHAKAATMLDELRERRRLRIYMTAACGNPHPYLADHENDMFRAVHDAFGHAATGSDFGPDGEEAAWLAHSYLYSPLARRALTTETRGQQAALIYGNQQGFPPPQKLCLLPAAFSELTNVTFRGAAR